jgi:hypothetical protein
MTARKIDWRDAKYVGWLAVARVPIRADRSQDIDRLSVIVRASGAIHNSVAMSLRRKALTIENGTSEELQGPYRLHKMKTVRDTRRIAHTSSQDERVAAWLQADCENRAWRRIAGLWVSIGILVAGLMVALDMLAQ